MGLEHRRPWSGVWSGKLAAGLLAATAMVAVLGVAVLGVAVLAAGPASAQSRSNSGITVNTDVLDSLGPGPQPLAPLPPAPLPQAAPTPLAPTGPGAAAPAGNQLRLLPPASGTRQTRGIVVTRPSTLLFPPLQNPSSTLTPGFSGDVAREQRKQAFDNAFANGPEPQSQLLLPLAENGGAAPQDDGEWVFETVIIESSPIPEMPGRKPAPTPAMLAALSEAIMADAAAQEPGLEETLNGSLPAVAVTPVETVALEPQLAPEFRSPPGVGDTGSEAASEPAPAQVAGLTPSDLQAEPGQAVEETAETRATALAEPQDGTLDRTPNDAQAETPGTTVAVATLPADQAAAPPSGPASDARDSGAAAPNAPVSLLPQDLADSGAAPAAASPETESSSETGSTRQAAVPALAEGTTQVASLPQSSEALGAGTAPSLQDVTFTFAADSAELSTTAQAVLRSLADDLRDQGDDRIQVLGYAADDGGSPELARQLALSRALKVRTFLMDAGISSARIQVRPPRGTADSGPANRVDIKPIGS